MPGRGAELCVPHTAGPGAARRGPPGRGRVSGPAPACGTPGACWESPHSGPQRLIPVSSSRRRAEGAGDTAHLVREFSAASRELRAMGFTARRARRGCPCVRIPARPRCGLTGGGGGGPGRRRYPLCPARCVCGPRGTGPSSARALGPAGAAALTFPFPLPLPFPVPLPVPLAGSPPGQGEP